MVLAGVPEKTGAYSEEMKPLVALCLHDSAEKTGQLFSIERYGSSLCRAECE